MGMVLAATVLIAATTALLARRDARDGATMMELERQASARLLGGGMHFVRPDLPGD